MTVQVAPTDYTPVHDPDIAEKVINDLIACPGQWREPCALFGVDATQAREIVEGGRACGLLIEGHGKGRRGYRFLCWRKLWGRRRAWQIFEALEETMTRPLSLIREVAEQGTQLALFAAFDRGRLCDWRGR